MKTPKIGVQGPPGPRLADWNLLRAFLAIFEAGTLTEAARHLGTTQPSMGRHLRELEAALDEPLFVRLPGRLTPTERAHDLYVAIATMGHAVRDAERLLSEGPERVFGTVRVAASEAYAHHVVAPLLAPLLNEQPDLEIELSVSNRADNLLRRDADIAVRFLRPQQDGVIARKVGETELGLYAHETLIEREGIPSGFEIPEHLFIAGFHRQSPPLEAAIQGEPPKVPLRFRWRCDAVLANQAAMECGAGLAMMFTDIAVTRPRLKRVLADRVRLRQEVWLCAHDELRRSKRMRFVWDHLGASLEARFAAAR